MRVIIITSSSNRSGGTRQALYQAEGLAARGHDVTLCLPHDSDYWTDPSQGQPPFWLRLPANPAAMRRVVEGLLPADPATPTIVHAFHNRAVKRLAWWGLCWKLRQPPRRLACVAHRGVIFRPGNPLPYLSPAMRGFLVNSTACGHALRFHCPPGKIHFVPNAIPDSRVTPSRDAATLRAALGLAETPCLFGYVGNDNPLKGAEQLFRAFAALPPAVGHLLAIGLSPDRWQPLCNSLGLADRVTLVAHDEAVCDYLQFCDVFVFPSYGMDSAPNTLMEAIRMGLPVIGTRVGGVPDMITDNGLLVPPRDIPALSTAMASLADSPPIRTLMAAASRQHGATYTVDARCQRLEALYDQFLQGA